MSELPMIRTMTGDQLAREYLMTFHDNGVFVANVQRVKQVKVDEAGNEYSEYADFFTGDVDAACHVLRRYLETLPRKEADAEPADGITVTMMALAAWDRGTT